MQNCLTTSKVDIAEETEVGPRLGSRGLGIDLRLGPVFPPRPRLAGLAGLAGRLGLAGFARQAKY